MPIPSNAPRPARYLAAEDALRYAHWRHAVPAARGWSQLLTDENLPGWTMNDVMHLLERHRLFAYSAVTGRVWRNPKVIGVLIEGDTLVRDTGNLDHPAKSAYRRFIAVGSTDVHYVRHLRGDASNVVLHVRTAANTIEQRHLHDVAREVYLASTVRPDLVLNVSGCPLDLFDGRYADVTHDGPRPHLDVDTLAAAYQRDLTDILRSREQKRGRIVLITLETHNDGPSIEQRSGTISDLPPRLRADANIDLQTISVRTDALHESARADTVAALVRLVERATSVE